MRPAFNFKYLGCLLMSLGLSACVVAPQPVTRATPAIRPIRLIRRPSRWW